MRGAGFSVRSSGLGLTPCSTASACFLTPTTIRKGSNCAANDADGLHTLVELLRATGYDMRGAADGRSAIAAAAAFMPQLFLLDIGLPDISGYDVARALRSSQATRQTMLVALTGWGAAADRRRSAAVGFDEPAVRKENCQGLLSAAGVIRQAEVERQQTALGSQSSGRGER